MAVALPKGYEPDSYASQVLHALEQSYDCVLLLGRAGTGKSTLIEHFKRTTKKKYVVLASTGVAAMNVGGQTIHSFFNLPPRLLAERDVDIQPWPDHKPSRQVVEQLDVLIIDEVSMVRADVLDAIDYSLQLQLKSDEPFGGLQVVLVGDTFQLPPVDRDSEGLTTGESPRYKSPHFFSSKVFKTKGLFRIFELQQVHRQGAGPFLEVLNRVRLGQIEEEDLQLLNARLSTADVDFTDKPPILLTTTNAIADRENQARLAALDVPLVMLEGTTSGDFPLTQVRTSAEIQLAPQARVMLLTNDTDRRWVNGSLGTVLEINLKGNDDSNEDSEDDDDEPDHLLVKLDAGLTVKVFRHQWENAVYKTKGEEITRQVKGTFTQFPVRLAWAITIHKSQGLTFDAMRLDIGYGTFAGGQLYVALSRCRSLEGIHLMRSLRFSDVMVDPVVQGFNNWLPQQMARDAERPMTLGARRPPKQKAKRGSDVMEALIAAQKAKKQEATRQAIQEKNKAEGKAANEGARYSATELEKLRSMWQAGKSLQDIGAEMGRKPSAIASKLVSEGRLLSYDLQQGWVVYAGLPKKELPTPADDSRKGEPWTEAEDARLKELAETRPPLAALVQELNRTATGLAMRMVQHGYLSAETPVWDVLVWERR